MQDGELQEIEGFAVKIARGAGQLLSGYFQKPLKVEFKSKLHRDPVTEADKRSEEFLKEAILKEFPGHSLLAEEGSHTDSQTSDFTWVLDPLDGTTNFLNGLPIYGVSIGVLYQGQPVVGSIFLPSTHSTQGSVFHARTGGGAFRDDNPIRVAQNPEPQRSQLTVLPTYYSRAFRVKKGLRQRLGEVRAPGSISYELAMTAAGTFQYSLFGGPRIWDVVAGLPLVTEAQGVALVRRGNSRRWEPFTTFAKTPGTSPSSGELKEWRGSWIFGNPSIAQYVASRITRRSMLELRIRRWLQRWF